MKDKMICACVEFGIECSIPENVLKEFPTQGDCSYYIESVIDRVVFDYTPDRLVKWLSEFGAWDSAELSDMTENEKRLLWLVAGDYHEDQLYFEEV